MKACYGIWIFLMAVSSTWAAQPNIVLIMADDLGLGDVGRHHLERTGKPPLAPTPAIDALADSGMWFSDAHSPTSLCSPSRYAVMTGNYNYRSYAPWGVWGSFRKTAIESHDATLGRVTQAAGYNTGFVGKWHLGGDFYTKGSTEIFRGKDRGDLPVNVDATTWIANGPSDMGFAYDFTLPCGVQGPVYVAYENGLWYKLAPDSELIHLTNKTAKNPLFVSDKGPGTGDSNWDPSTMNQILAEKAVSFINKQSEEASPFFLCYWSPAVHLPHTPADELDGEAIRGTTPSQHLDMVRVLDWEVEQMVHALKETGAYENTLILFTSDNGGLVDEKAKKVGHLSSGGWRGSKNHPYEGGHRVPFIAVWPGKIEADSQCQALVNGTDILATFAAIAGTKLKRDQAMDSFDLMPLFLGEKPSLPRNELMHQAGSKCELVYRVGDWKLIMQSDWQLSKMEPIALFNLSNNPREVEEQNFINHPEYSSRVKAMHQRFVANRTSDERSAP